MSKKDEGNDLPTAPFWMATFSDMMTLLLVLFVLIVSMSKVEVEKFKEAISYFQGRTGVLQNNAALQQPQPFQSPMQERRIEALTSYLEEKGLEDKVRVEVTEEGVRTVITDSVMFESGRAELIEPASTVLSLLAGVIDADVQAVAVEGHTDSRPIQTSKYPSNWELSAARASSVVRFLQTQEDVLDPGQYAAIGYGEHRPVAPNQTADGRAQNRRVEILFSWKSWPKTNPSNPKKEPNQTPTPMKLPPDRDLPY